MVSSTTITSTLTSTSIPPKARIVISTAAVAPPPARAGGAVRYGSQAWPFQRHRPSAEIADRHWPPSHHQKPSGVKVVGGLGADGPGGSFLTA